MGCTGCAGGNDSGMPRGCRNNGTCGTDGCNKLTVTNWLSNMKLPANVKPFSAVEVRFKNGRKEFFQNPEKLSLQIGDTIATEATPGHDIGIVTLTGELVRVQMKKKRVPLDLKLLPKVYRKATQADIDLWQSLREKEQDVQKRSREIAIRHGLQMKISDVEYQGDGSKVIFYYTAEDRVDFRQLIKDYAHTFNTRIEMKQIGFRQEAARLGGIGSCGRELCCSTWLTDFRSVSTSAARYQQLSLNPQKLAGQCGKLKCCLNYELDMYLEALDSFPNTDTKLITAKGVASCQKIDIFKGRLWYAYENDSSNWHEITVEKANRIIAENTKGNKPIALEDFVVEEEEKETGFDDGVGQDSLTRFDKPKKPRKKQRFKKKTGEKTSADKSNKPNPRNKRSNRKRKPKKNE